MRKGPVLALGICVVVVAAVAWHYARPSPVPTLATHTTAANARVMRQATADEKVYDNAAFGFALIYPKELAVTEQGKGTDFTVGFLNIEKHQGFQVFVTPYNKPTITQERFATDLPSRVMQNPIDITVDGAPATMFISSDPALGPTQEIWFLHGGYLYEVTAPQALGEWLLQIMQSWQFK